MNGPKFCRSPTGEDLNGRDADSLCEKCALRYVLMVAFSYLDLDLVEGPETVGDNHQDGRPERN